MSRAGDWLRPAVYLGQNPISLIGAVLTTSAAITMIGFWYYELVHAGPTRPYAGIVFFFILPAIFYGPRPVADAAKGFLRRYRLKRRGKLPRLSHDRPAPADAPARARPGRDYDLHQRRAHGNRQLQGRRAHGLRGVLRTDVPLRHGARVHGVSELPAFARVACVDCHIGSGAPWFVRAKISGVRQLFAVNLKTYSRPIPSPVHNLRPSRDTCERCHWPERFTGDKLLGQDQVRRRRAEHPLDDRPASKIGGRTTQGLVGIAGRHLAAAERIEYVSTDGRRQVIPSVTYTQDDGKKVEYVSDEVKATPAELARAERRKMDCVDCHNRPTHAFEMPERAVDQAITAGRIDRQLPYIKKQAVAALRVEYPDRATASAKIPQAIDDFYKAKYPDTYQGKRPIVETAAQQVTAIYLRNIFPEMKITWGTHPNNIGHDDFLGCFRCHDGKHKAADGRVINDDCSACHQILAMEEKDPKVLADLGLK